MATRKMDPQSESDAAVMAALGEEVVAKGCDKPGEMSAGADQGKANGGKMEPLKKNDEEEEGREEEKEEKDEDEDEDEDEDKSFTQSDIQKSIDRAMAIAQGGALDNTDRRQELADKLSKGDLSSDERDELLRSLAPDAKVDSDDEPLQRSYAYMATDDPEIASATTGDDGTYDVSGFLQRQAGFIGGALDDVAGEVRKGFAREQSYDLELAKSIGQIGRLALRQESLIKSMARRLEVLENTPMARRGVSTAAQAAQQLQRGFGPNSQAPELSRDEMVKGLVKLQRESNDGKTPAGTDIVWATAAVECGQGVPDSLHNEIRKALNK